MSWLFSQALVAEYSAGSCSDGEPFAQLNVMPTPHKFWRNDKTMEFSKLSQFGLTLQLLTVDHGEALLMSYLAAFHARTSAQPEKVQALPVPDQACGKKWPALLAKYNPDSSLWKTAQCSLFGDLELCLETWPRWGSMRNGACFLQPMLAPTTSAKESGFWATPAASDGSRGGTLTENMTGQSLAQMVNTPTRWPTPRAQETGNYQNVNRDVNGVSRGIALTLTGAVKKYPTPTASASASKGSSPASLVRKNGKSRVKDRLDHTVMASNGGQLNPTWVEWLMGWPLGWTDLKGLATDRCLSVPQQLSSC